MNKIGRLPAFGRLAEVENFNLCTDLRTGFWRARCSPPGLVKRKAGL